MPFFAFPPAIRKMICTTNAVESLHRSLRQVGDQDARQLPDWTLRKTAGVEG